MKELSTPVAILISGALISLAVLFQDDIKLTSPLLKAKSGGQAQATNPTPTPQPGQEELPAFVDVTEDDDPSFGDKNAKVLLVEFSDFQCPFCKRFFDDSLSKIKTEYLNTGKARLVYRDFPLSFHQNAQLSAEASECADEQNNFWGYHDALFNKQSEWSPLSNADATTKFVSYASELGLNSSTFQSCLSSGKYKEEVQKDIEEGSKFGVGGTPTVFINGKRIIGAQPYETFKTEIEAALSNAN